MTPGRSCVAVGAGDSRVRLHPRDTRKLCSIDRYAIARELTYRARVALSAPRASILRSIAVEAVRHPRLLAEVPAWLRDRNRSTVDVRQPWWPYQAANAVAALLPEGASVLEFGGGGSSLWLHDRGARLTVVEHVREWYETLRGLLPSDVTLLLREPTQSGDVTSDAAPGSYFDHYVKTVAGFGDDSLDLVIVDGRARVACARASAEKVRRGGALLVDDSDRPRYAEIAAHLSTWHRTDVRGLKPGGGGVHQTTMWRRPS